MQRRNWQKFSTRLTTLREASRNLVSKSLDQQIVLRDMVTTANPSSILRRAVSKSLHFSRLRQQDIFRTEIAVSEVGSQVLSSTVNRFCSRCRDHHRSHACRNHRPIECQFTALVLRQACSGLIFAGTAFVTWIYRLSCELPRFFYLPKKKPGLSVSID